MALEKPPRGSSQQGFQGRRGGRAANGEDGGGVVPIPVFHAKKRLSTWYSENATVEDELEKHALVSGARIEFQRDKVHTLYNNPSTATIVLYGLWGC